MFATSSSVWVIKSSGLCQMNQRIPYSDIVIVILILIVIVILLISECLKTDQKTLHVNLYLAWNVHR